MEAEARSEVNRIRSVDGVGSKSKAESTEVEPRAEIPRTRPVQGAESEARSEADRMRPVQGAGSKSKTKWIKSLFAHGKRQAK